MTVKELAEFTGKTDRTILRWIEKTCDILSDDEKESIKQKLQTSWRTKKAADYDIEDIEKILNHSSMSKDAVRILMENARKPVATLEVQTAPNQMDVLLSFMERQQNINQQFMTTVLSELKGYRQQPLQTEQPKQDYFSLIAYCSLKKIKTNSSELKKMGMDLRKIAISTGKELHKIPDERYGQVNSYPVEVLDEYFSE